jgi:MraZ protein
MPLTGTYQRTLDDKRRVAVPKRLRDEFGEVDLKFLYIAPGTEKSLVVYAPVAFEALAAKLAGNPSQQNYLRLFYASAERCDLDSQGRIRIPDRLADYAHLTHDAYLLGVRDHAELWDKTAWDSFSLRLNNDFDQLATAAWTG